MVWVGGGGWWFLVFWFFVIFCLKMWGLGLWSGFGGFGGVFGSFVFLCWVVYVVRDVMVWFWFFGSFFDFGGEIF